MSIGENIRRLREREGLSQTAFAGRLGVTKETVGRWESGRNYTIALDPDTLTLFGYIEVDDPERWAAGADTAINRKWWDFMADIMETNEDNSPVSVDLPVLFHLD